MTFPPPDFKTLLFLSLRRKMYSIYSHLAIFKIYLEHQTESFLNYSYFYLYVYVCFQDLLKN